MAHDPYIRALEELAADAIRYHRTSQPSLEAMSKRARLDWQRLNGAINALPLSVVLHLSTVGTVRQEPANDSTVGDSDGRTTA
jgi:hypothetical protein